MKQLQVFQNGLFSAVRATMIDDNPWFIATDVTYALGYANNTQAIQDNVFDEDRQVVNGKDYTLANDPANSPISKQNITIINESGVYALIFGSKQERAREFKRWVTHEVLPALRRTGRYSMGPGYPELTGDQAVELAKVLQEVAPTNMPYFLAALKMLGYDVLDDPRLLWKDADVSEAKVYMAWYDIRGVQRIAQRDYPFDYDLIKQLCKFRDDRMSMYELAERSFVPPSTMHRLQKGYTNACPEYARRIKENMAIMYAEREKRAQAKALAEAEKVKQLAAKQEEKPQREFWQRLPGSKKSGKRFLETSDEVALTLRKAYDLDISLSQVSARCGIARPSLYKYMWGDRHLTDEKQRRKVIDAADSLIVIATAGKEQTAE